MVINCILKSELKNLQKSKSDLQSKLASFPSGELHVWKNGKGYRWVKYEDNNGALIPKENFQEAVALAQKKYTACQIEDIEQKENALKKCIAILEKPSKSETFSVKEGFRELLDAANLDLVEYSKQWEMAPYKKSTYKSEFCKHETLKGDLVRSKAEALIADSLFRASIPYRYDQEMQFGSTIICPDFVILSKGQEILWEHMGLLTKEDYSRTNMSKISTYLAYGFFPGDNLLISSESEDRPLNACTVERVINCFLL